MAQRAIFEYFNQEGDVIARATGALYLQDPDTPHRQAEAGVSAVFEIARSIQSGSLDQELAENIHSISTDKGEKVLLSDLIDSIDAEQGAYKKDDLMVAQSIFPSPSE